MKVTIVTSDFADAGQPYSQLPDCKKKQKKPKNTVMENPWREPQVNTCIVKMFFLPLKCHRGMQLFCGPLSVNSSKKML